MSVRAPLRMTIGRNLASPNPPASDSALFLLKSPQWGGECQGKTYEAAKNSRTLALYLRQSAESRRHPCRAGHRARAGATPKQQQVMF